MVNNWFMNNVRNLRVIGFLEGVSYLVLLLVAMPLKYAAGIPEVVTVVGWMHGVLFVAYGVCVLLAIRPMNWGFKGVAVAGIASLVPLGTFFLDKQLKTRETELREERRGVEV